MIIGACPYCDEIQMVEVPDDRKLPVMEHRVCSECSKSYWLLHSRLDPEAYTEEAFATLYVMDEDTGKLIPVMHSS